MTLFEPVKTDDSSGLTRQTITMGEEVTEDNENDTENTLPLAFTSKRHIEKIEGSKSVTQTWRMKERVRTNECRYY